MSTLSPVSGSTGSYSTGLTSIQSSLGSIGKRSIKITNEHLNGLQRAAQFVKVIVGIPFTLLLGCCFPSMRQNIYEWWNEFRTGNRVVKKWEIHSMPDDTHLTHQVGLVNLASEDTLAREDDESQSNDELNHSSKSLTNENVSEEKIVHKIKKSRKVSPFSEKDFKTDVLKGGFKNGLLEGYGKLTPYGNSIPGFEVEGNFVAGLLNGPGKITFDYGVVVIEGNFEEGEFRQGNCQNGQGKIVSQMGEIRGGTFLNGMLNGPGRVTDDSFEWTGIFKDDNLIEGKRVYSHEIEEGFFNHTRRLNGQGKTIDTKNHIIARGIFKDGLLNGPGEVTFANGVVRKGNFEKGFLRIGIQLLNGEFHGVGLLISQRGEVWSGEFKKGTLIKGTKTEPNGEITLNL